MKKIFIPLVLLSLFVQLGSAQSRKVYENAAEAAFVAKDYSSALGYYEILLDQAEYEDLESYYKAGEAAYNMNLFNRSERYFQWAIDHGGREQFSTLDFQMAQTKKRLEKYAEAKALFEKYKTEHPSSTNGYSEIATAEIAACIWAMDLVANPVVNIHSSLAVTNMEMVEHLDTTINTKYTELAPMLREGTLYHSSIRYFAGEEAAPFARILSSTDGALATPVTGLGGNNQSIAHSAFNATGTRIYFTICDTLAQGYRCAIYYRDKEGDSWGSAVKLPENINDKNHTATHPAVGTDHKTGEELLFFVSGRAGGQGGLDIWCSIISKEGNVGAPYNVAGVNTAGDDITPYFHGKKNTLYFSSNGRQSLGGFDVYKSVKEGQNWSTVVHTGYPLNSAYDDVYLSLNEKGDLAHLSSNRPGGICKDTTTFECVCDDIYAVEVPFIDLIVETYNKITGDQLTGTVVALQAGQGLTDAKGPDANEYQYAYDLDFNQDYQVKGTKEKYISDSDEFDTYEMTESGTIIKKLYLTPEVDVLAKTYDKSTGMPLMGTTIKLVEITTIDTLSKRDPAQYSQEYPLQFKKRYLLVATKDNYLPDSVEVFTDNIPIVPTYLKRNLFLCRKPFDANPEIVLYFDNDIPKKLSTNHSQTNSNYEQTVKAYISEKKVKEYLDAFATAEEKQEVTDFFSKVNSNYARLDNFANNLYTYLKNPEVNDTVVITIKGYASPLAKPAYNKLLTERRIYSVEKYLEDYNGGILRPYLKQVRVQREPYGEAAAKGGSEDRKNKKASIYSIDASQERRVEIINISSSVQVCPTENPEPQDNN